MVDRYNRHIRYLRISVIDRCNLRCRYCMPREGITPIPRSTILSYEEIYTIVQQASHLGFDKVRITGGEPLIRKNIVHLIAMLSPINGITDLSMTTNGLLLSRYAKPLYDAGLQRLNISLDTLDPERYAHLTRGGDINETLKGIEAARNTGFTPIKLNCVITTSPDEPDAQQVAAYAHDNGFEVRFIRQMNIKNGTFWKVEGGKGGACDACDRLRITSDGTIIPCLFSDTRISLRDYGIEKALKRAVALKPESGHKSIHNTLYTLGG